VIQNEFNRLAREKARVKGEGEEEGEEFEEGPGHSIYKSDIESKYGGKKEKESMMQDDIFESEKGKKKAKIKSAGGGGKISVKPKYTSSKSAAVANIGANPSSPMEKNETLDKRPKSGQKVFNPRKYLNIYLFLNVIFMIFQLE
jgi:hypothetical protein